MIASDIHGSALYCEKMLDAFAQEQADQLLLLGDILYHGPRNDLPDGYAPKEVIKLLNPLKSKILCVRGNCDTEVDQMVLEFPILAESCLLWLDGRRLFAVHGHKSGPETLPLSPGDLLFSGHTHIPHDKEVNGIRWLNPGSVSIPKENTPHSYMIWQNGTPSFRSLS